MLRSVAVIASFAVVFSAAYLLMGGSGSGISNVRIELLGSALASLSSITLAYLFIGALEESTKHLALYPSLETNFSDPKYIALATAFTALGFAFLENVYYLVHIALDTGIFSSSFV
jgi:RsiW-degrading membrane proteinase PrsW (M82 family)